MRTNRLKIDVLLWLWLCLSVLQTASGQQSREIFKAINAGDLNKVQALIESDSILLESKDDDGNTPLIIACQSRQLAVANFLIDKGANVNAKGTLGVTPLLAVRKKDEFFDLIQRLVAKGADVNAKMTYTNRNYTVFCSVVKSGSLKIAKFLIDHGADINVNDIEGTPLQMVIYNEEMAKLLIESGAKLQEFSYGNTELHMAAMKGCADLVPLLVKHGADVNAVNDYGHTALYYATKHGHRKTADALIDLGANKNAIVETNYGKAPQLTEQLKEGEAYLWYLGGPSSSGYAVKTKEHLLLFNPQDIGESSESGLANGYLVQNELTGQKISVLVTHWSGQNFSKLGEIMPGADFILNFKPDNPPGMMGGFTIKGDKESKIPPYRLANPNESFSMNGIQVHTIPAMPGEGALGYLAESDGIRIFHAGLHATVNDSLQIIKYRKQIDFLTPFGPVDMVILPIRGRHLDADYEPYLYLLDQLSPKVVYLIGDELVTEEHKKCIEVLRARNIPVAYPEGGLALGERFHYLRDSSQK